MDLLAKFHRGGREGRQEKKALRPSACSRTRKLLGKIRAGGALSEKRKSGKDVCLSR